MIKKMICELSVNDQFKYNGSLFTVKREMVGCDVTNGIVYATLHDAHTSKPTKSIIDFHGDVMVSPFIMCNNSKD